MKRILSVLAILISLSSYSQTLNSDSLKYKKIYVQLDLPGLLSVEYKSNFQIPSKYFYAYTPNINATAGYSFKGDIAKKIKKSVQLNVLYYTSIHLIDEFLKNKEYSFINDHSTYLSISPELKLLFNKKTDKRGLYGTIGVGYSQQKVFASDDVLYENKTGWNLLGSAGYLITTKKKFYFDFNFGVNSFFVCKSVNLKFNHNILTEEEYYDFIQKNFPEPGLTSITFIDSNTVQYNYKTAGLSSYQLIPRLGIAIGIRF